MSFTVSECPGRKCQYRSLQLINPLLLKTIADFPISWRPGGGKPPVLLSTSKEARGVCLEKYTVCFDAYHRNETYAIFTAFGLDTLYCKNKLPDNVYMKRVRFHPVNTILPKGVSGRELNLRSWTRSVRSLMVNLDDAAAGVSHTRRQGLWEKLALTCPELEELNIVFSHNAKVRKHHSLKDLVEADLSIATGPQLALIVQFRLAHQAQLAEGKFLGLKVNFVQLSPLASRALDKLLQGPDATPGSNARPKFIKPSRRYPERYRYRK